MSYAQALIRMIRTPQPYYGSNDYILEKYMKVVVALFFDPNDVYFVQ